MIFITGTNTGSGKTLLTALLLSHLLRHGQSAIAAKPFCTGDPGDVRLFHAVTQRKISKELINPFYFSEPVTPLVAARKEKRVVAFESVMAKAAEWRRQFEWVLVEGCGGLLAPLGEGFTNADLISALRCPVVVAARNQLGVLNHVLLTVHALRALKVRRMKIVLMDQGISSLAAKTNAGVLRELLGETPVFQIPFLGGSASRSSRRVKSHAIILKKTLAQVVETATF